MVGSKRLLRLSDLNLAHSFHGSAVTLLSASASGIQTVGITGYSIYHRHSKKGAERVSFISMFTPEPRTYVFTQ